MYTMQKQKRKEVLKFIRRSVQQLPEETYLAYHKYYTPRMEENDKGEMIQRYGYLGTHICNHYRRAKRSYDKYGYAGLDAYLRLFGFQLSQQKQ
jgi:hypothetical protein